MPSAVTGIVGSVMRARILSMVLAPLALLTACGDDGSSARGDGSLPDRGGNVSIETAPANASGPVPAAAQTPPGPTWFFRDDPGGGLALYGQSGAQGLFAIRCDRRGGRILFQRAGEAADAAELTLSIDGGQSRYPAHPRTGGTPRIEASTAVEDPVIEQIARARTIGISATGTQTISLPGNGAVRRVIEACRAPAQLAAVPDGARFTGTLPCTDCGGIDVMLSFSAKGPETERFRLVRAWQGRTGSEVSEGSVAVIADQDPPVYRLDPDDGGLPVYLTRIASDRFVFRTPANGRDPELEKHPITRAR